MKDTPAFPQHRFVNSPYVEGGMTIRQYAAIKAMQGLLAGYGMAKTAWNTGAPDYFAAQAILCTDALLAELEKGQSDETN